MIYSGTEKLVGGISITGRPIYAMSFAVSATASGNTEQIVNIALPATLSRILKVEGGLWTSSNDGFYPIEYINPNAPSTQNSQFKLNIVSGQWTARFNTGGAGTMYFTVYYCK